MRILIALTYFRPHVSGLTIYTERLARGLARRGHRVTVLTSHFAAHLPAREAADGVEVVRVPVLMKAGKGVIMPLFPFYAAALIPRHQVINVHMPQFEAAALAGMARLARRRLVLTYHCDLKLPRGWVNRVVDSLLPPLNALAATTAHAIVVNSSDYAEHSPFLSRYRAKLHAISPPIDLPQAIPAVTERLLKESHIEDAVRIGFAARFASEKGVEYLLKALPQVLKEFPKARIVFTGAYRDTVGEENYRRRLAPLIEEHAAQLIFLDLLAADEMPSFFALCHVVAVTSLNATESFGLVQPEAMLSGTPVVATDLPGVREAVRRTGMGRLVPPRDSNALAQSLIEVLRNRHLYVKPHRIISSFFDTNRSLSAYEKLFAAADT